METGINGVMAESVIFGWQSGVNEMAMAIESGINGGSMWRNRNNV